MRIKDILAILDRNTLKNSIWTDIACWNSYKGFALSFEGRKVLIVSDQSKDQDAIYIHSGFEDQFDVLYGNAPIAKEVALKVFTSNDGQFHQSQLLDISDYIGELLGLTGELYLR